MKIEKNAVVSIHYTLKNAGGEILDSSDGRDPLVYMHGNGNLIIGLENQLENKTIHDKLDVTILPEDAYGLYREDLVQVVSRELFEGIEDIREGMQFHAQANEGNQVITVSKVDGDKITIDANHALAGETLFFTVEIIDIRQATLEEISHGHVHGAGGHHH